MIFLVLLKDEGMGREGGWFERVGLFAWGEVR